MWGTWEIKFVRLAVFLDESTQSILESLLWCCQRNCVATGFLVQTVLFVTRYGLFSLKCVACRPFSSQDLCIIHDYTRFSAESICICCSTPSEADQAICGTDEMFFGPSWSPVRMLLRWGYPSDFAFRCRHNLASFITSWTCQHETRLAILGAWRI